MVADPSAPSSTEPKPGEPGQPDPSKPAGTSGDDPGRGATAPPTDPFEGRTTEDILKQLQEHRGDDFKAFTSEEWEKGRRQGQGEGTKAFNAEKEKWQAEEQAVRTFDHFARLRDSEDPRDHDEFTKAMRTPKVKGAFDAGEKLRSAPSGEDVEKLKIDLAADVLSDVFQGIQGLPEFKELSDADKASVAFDKFTLAAPRVLAMVKTIIKGGRAGVTTETLAKAKQEGRKELLDEMGLKQSDVDGGRGAAPKGSLAQLAAARRAGKISDEEYRLKFNEMQDRGDFSQ